MSIFSLTNHEIFLITAKHDDRESGFIATWVMPATLIPDTPRIVAVFSPENFTFELIQKSKHFVVHMLAEDQIDLVSRFGMLSGREIKKFEGIKITRTKSGLPLIPDTCGWNECRVVDQIDSGDRVIVLADVIDRGVEAEKKPLRKETLLTKLPKETVDELQEKRRHDGERDKHLIRHY